MGVAGLVYLAYLQRLAPSAARFPLPAQPRLQQAASGRTTPVYSYLLMTIGPRAGARFQLDATKQNLIGRGTECSILLSDALCSRVHAVLEHRDGLWQIRDKNSRNGTFLDGQRIDEAELVDGALLRVGSTEFSFHRADRPTEEGQHRDGSVYTQTIVMDTPIGDRAGDDHSLALLPDMEQAKELWLLYQLTTQLLGCDDPQEVITRALELLRARTQAAVVGFLWLDDEGKLRPKIILPQDAAPQVHLSDSLTRLVIEQGHAVWVASHSPTSTSDSTSLKHYADAVCVPLVRAETTHGAIHIYLDRGRFRQSDFAFSISVAHILVVALVRARIHWSLQTNYERLVAKSAEADELIGESKPMHDLKSRIARVARASGCVLIRGPSGSGKELVARAVHRSSPRADRPMLTVNCAAIPVELMESQLFGHKAGAFTGADRDHVGLFEQADLGTLFLDEVGELTLAGQAKLLRILEGHPFLPVGGNEEIRVDVRVLAATNQDLQHYVEQKRFREDLYYRLSVFELCVPPLAQRGSDVELLLDFFLTSFKQQHGRPHLQLSDEARAQLLAYSWPGNVRQLRNSIDSAVVLAEGERIEPGDLGLRPTVSGEMDTLRIDAWERKLVQEALRRTGGNVPDAAKLLGIGRATLYRKIDQYHIAR